LTTLKNFKIWMEYVCKLFHFGSIFFKKKR
jgi:hypothetical protein